MTPNVLYLNKTLEANNKVPKPKLAFIYLFMMAIMRFVISVTNATVPAQHFNLVFLVCDTLLYQISFHEWINEILF